MFLYLSCTAAFADQFEADHGANDISGLFSLPKLDFETIHRKPIKFKKSERRGLENDAMGVFVVGTNNCGGSVKMRVEDLTNGKKLKEYQTRKIANSRDHKRAGYGLNYIVLPPGKYRFMNSTCQMNSSVSYNRHYGDWFGDFEITAGTVTYGGTILVKQHTFKIKGSLDGLPFMKSSPDSYLIYLVRDHTAFVEDIVASHLPELASKFETKIIEQPIDPKIVTEIIHQAYTPENGEQRVDKDKARRQISTSLTRYFLTARWDNIDTISGGAAIENNPSHEEELAEDLPGKKQTVETAPDSILETPLVKTDYSKLDQQMYMDRQQDLIEKMRMIRKLHAGTKFKKVSKQDRENYLKLLDEVAQIDVVLNSDVASRVPTLPYPSGTETH